MVRMEGLVGRRQILLAALEEELQGETLPERIKESEDR